MLVKRAPISRTNTGSVCAIEALKRMWILFQTVEPIFWGVTAAVLQPGLDVEVAEGGGFGALLAPRERAAGFCQGKAQRVTSKGRGMMYGQEGRVWQSCV